MTPQGAPQQYSNNGVSGTGDGIIDIYPIPDGVYTLRCNMIVRPADLVDATDVMDIPERPVQLLAYAKAIEERGEDGGIAASSAYEAARRSLSDHIAFDSNKHPEDTVWENASFDRGYL